jgi:hypothetical protein
MLNSPLKASPQQNNFNYNQFFFDFIASLSLPLPAHKSRRKCRVAKVAAQLSRRKCLGASVAAQKSPAQKSQNHREFSHIQKNGKSTIETGYAMTTKCLLHTVRWTLIDKFVIRYINFLSVFEYVE